MKDIKEKPTERVPKSNVSGKPRRKAEPSCGKGPLRRRMVTILPPKIPGHC